MNVLSTETYANIFASARARIEKEMVRLHPDDVNDFLSIVADEIASELAASDPLFSFDCFINKLGVDDVHRERKYEPLPKDVIQVVPNRYLHVEEHETTETLNLMDANMNDVRDLLSNPGMHVTSDYNRFEATAHMNIGERGTVDITETKAAKYHKTAPNYRPVGKSTYSADVTIWGQDDNGLCRGLDQQVAVGNIYGDDHKTLAECVRTAKADYRAYLGGTEEDRANEIEIIEREPFAPETQIDRAVDALTALQDEEPTNPIIRPMHTYAREREEAIEALRALDDNDMVVQSVEVTEIIDYKGKTYYRNTVDGTLVGWEYQLGKKPVHAIEARTLDAAYANRHDQRGITW